MIARTEIPSGTNADLALLKFIFCILGFGFAADPRSAMRRIGSECQVFFILVYLGKSSGFQGFQIMAWIEAGGKNANGLRLRYSTFSAIGRCRSDLVTVGSNVFRSGGTAKIHNLLHRARVMNRSAPRADVNTVRPHTSQCLRGSAQ